MTKAIPTIRSAYSAMAWPDCRRQGRLRGLNMTKTFTGDDARPWFLEGTSCESSPFWVAAQGAHRSIAVENLLPRSTLTKSIVA
jgi:hypothetical protein